MPPEHGVLYGSVHLWWGTALLESWEGGMRCLSFYYQYPDTWYKTTRLSLISMQTTLVPQKVTMTDRFTLWIFFPLTIVWGQLTPPSTLNKGGTTLASRHSSYILHDPFLDSLVGVDLLTLFCSKVPACDTASGQPSPAVVSSDLLLQ